MAEPFLGEIRLMSFGFAPKGWALCNGQLLPIQQNGALFSLFGTTYGGDGRTTFGLPNLQGRTPIQVSPDVIGTMQGEENHTLSLAELPTHTHQLNATGVAGSTPAPLTNVLAAATNVYGNPAQTSLIPGTLTAVGGGQAHTNMQPYLVINFCIALQGIFPSQT